MREKDAFQGIVFRSGIQNNKEETYHEPAVQRYELLVAVFSAIREAAAED